MGIFSRIMGTNKDEEKVQEQVEPFSLQYSDGTIASVTFNGIVDVDGKMVHTANIHYQNPDGTFMGRSVLLEPIMRQSDDGNWIDATEDYYRSLSNRDGSRESQLSYNAVKGFFKKQDIDENIIGSNYIGNLARMENGQYYRHYDSEFREKCIEKRRLEIQAQVEAKKQRDNDFLSSLQSQVETNPVHYKTSHAEHLTREKSPFKDR